MYPIAVLVLLALCLACAAAALLKHLKKRRLQRALEHDSLTGLPNRLGFARLAGHVLDRAAAGDYVLVCVDMENFKL
ncbi:MAG: GGDEF domain-containing protein, partial [Clostridia bacterium]|nr:GGDEF domain-containing protein [Clostridia bacterium]